MSGPGIVPAEKIYGGDGWSRTLTISQGGTPVDLTAGWSGWKAQWRPTAAARTAIDITIDTTDAASGVLRLSLTGAQTGSMGGDGVWDLQATPTGGEPVTWVRQQTTWQQDVTRA